jgi:hypothetical protein
MALQEMQIEEATEVVLKYRFKELLSKGQIQNIAHDMLNEKLWEEYQEISFHKELYNCAVLMKWAFPRKFPETNALKCVIEVMPQNKYAKEIL